MTMKTQVVKRTSQDVPRSASNPAAGIVADTIEHHGLTQKDVAAAMQISSGLLSDIIRDKKRISVELALRIEACIGLPADFLIKLQGYHEYCIAYHKQGAALKKEIPRLVPV